MRRLALAAVFVLVAVPFLVQPPCGGVALAISGCCKQKKGDDWVKISRDFPKCKALNAKDGDNIFKRAGRFWWDTRC